MAYLPYLPKEGQDGSLLTLETVQRISPVFAYCSGQVGKGVGLGGGQSSFIG